MHRRLNQDYPGINLEVISASLKGFAEIPVKALSTGLVDAYIGNLLSLPIRYRQRGIQM